MTVIRTFLDAGVLITAARGTSVDANSALELLKDPNREFAASPFLNLEVLPKAIFNQRTLEVEFYKAYFDAVTHWTTDIEQIFKAGYRQAAEFGLGAMDAFHIAAAVESGSNQFITTEKTTKCSLAEIV